MIDNNNLCPFCLLTHLANVTIAIETAFHPRALIAVSSYSTANIAWKLETERLKVACKVRVRIIDDIQKSLKITVLSIELQPCALGLEAVKAEIVSDTLDEGSFKVFDMFLHKRNIFVEKLLL